MYIPRHQNTVAQYIATRSIMDLCLAAEQNPGLHLSRRWWGQSALDIPRTSVVHAEAKRGEGRRKGRNYWKEKESRVG